MMTGLTPQQDKLLRFIEASIEESRIAPSFESMKAHLGINSSNSITKLLRGLQERGYIDRQPNRSRAITLPRPLAKVPAYQLMAELRARGIPVKVDVL